MDRIDADGLLLVPAARPPHKPDRRLSGAGHRRAMLELALGNRRDCALSTFELDRSEPSYTVHTLQHLRQTLGSQVDLRLLIGADMAAIFYQWKDPHQILELAEPVVMMRPPWDEQQLLDRLRPHVQGEQLQRWRSRIVPVEQMDISSTRLRQVLGAGGYDNPLAVWALEPIVLAYIREHGLYRQV